MFVTSVRDSLTLTADCETLSSFIMFTESEIIPVFSVSDASLPESATDLARLLLVRRMLLIKLLKRKETFLVNASNGSRICMR